MNAHPNSDNRLITALRRMTVEQLLQLGTSQVVYLRAGMRDGKLAFMLYGADGLPLALVDDVDTAVEMVVENGLCFAIVH